MWNDLEIAKFLGECVYDPLKHVIGSYPWNTDPTIQIVPLPEKYRDRFPGVEYGPDEWACAFLDRLGSELKERGFDGTKPVMPVRFATVTGHGTGKSTLAAWLIKFIMDTRPMSVGSVTANTDEQLRTKTWSELGKWHSISLTESWFVYTSSRSSMALEHKDPEYKQRWKCHAKTCDPTKSESFAGQHSAGGSSFYIFDEASRIDDRIYEVREGGLVSGEPMAFDFGNGTRNTGMFYENCVGRFRNRNIVTSIDSRNVHLTNKEKIEQDRQHYGEDSDFFKTRWRGLFPSQASTQFIDSTTVRGAMERLVPKQNGEPPLILGIDVARFGDDETVVFPRYGLDLRTYEPLRIKGADTTYVAEAVVDMINRFRAAGLKIHSINIDGGGGYGGGVVDRLRERNVPCHEVMGGHKAKQDDRYQLMIDEMWGRMRDNLEHCVLPEETTDLGRELFDQLTQREYGVNVKGQTRLESKTSMKSRGVPSPDLADAMALTFTRSVVSNGDFININRPRFVKMPEADPFEMEYA